MKFFEDTVSQRNKYNQSVCGDAVLCDRTVESTVFVLCDGIGSGVYANIAAITCANRLMELARSGISMRSVCELVAESMHRAREEQIPFAAFTAVKVLKDGQFTVRQMAVEGEGLFYVEDGAPVRVDDECRTGDGRKDRAEVEEPLTVFTTVPGKVVVRRFCVRPVPFDHLCLKVR